MQEPVEAPEELPTREAGGGRGKRAMEEHQEHNLPLPSSDSVYILPSPAAHSTPETPTGKATPFALPTLQNFKKLVATVQSFATTSKTLVAPHIAWHNGWFECWFILEHLDHNNSISSTSSNSLQRLEKLVWRGSVSPTICFHFSCLILFYFILF